LRQLKGAQADDFDVEVAVAADLVESVLTTGVPA